METGPKHRIVIQLEPIYQTPKDYENRTGFVPLWITGSETVHEVIWHPEECDKLKYGETCNLDRFISENGFETGFDSISSVPTKLGEYWIWVWYESYFNGDVTEYDSGLECEKIGPLPPGYCDEVNEFSCHIVPSPSKQQESYNPRGADLITMCKAPQ